MSFFYAYSAMKLTRVSLQSNLDELIQLLHTLFSSIDTCVAMTSVHPASIAVKHVVFSSIDTCVAIESVHPASIAVKHALFSSKNTRRQ